MLTITYNKKRLKERPRCQYFTRRDVNARIFALEEKVEESSFHFLGL